MNEPQIYAMIDERLELALPKSAPTVMLPIKQFDALDDDDLPVTVIGVAYQEDEMNMVVLKERDGEIYPLLLSSVFRKDQPHLGASF